MAGQLLSVGCMAVVSGCATWHTVDSPPGQVLAGNPEAVRVTLKDGRHEVIVCPRLVDSLLVGQGGAGVPVHQAAVPFDSIAGIEVSRGPDTGTSLAYLVFGTFAAMGVFIALLQSAHD